MVLGARSRICVAILSISADIVSISICLFLFFVLTNEILDALERFALLATVAVATVAEVLGAENLVPEFTKEVEKHCLFVFSDFLEV